ncbi:mobile mystery protein B [Candidatus Falkowbacteria bacterium]|nr:mobile mystery protein B [Candidatus Falkowbacteria bacterium]
MGLNIVSKKGQTPIEDDDREYLKIKGLSSLEELNFYEHENITKARRWLLKKKKFKAEEVLREKFILEIHKKMFADVWLFAGKLRDKDMNIGSSVRNIRTDLRNLIDDFKYWLDNKTFSQEEMIVRFKHRLVKIHPFRNGNGRHSRLMAEVLCEKVFSLAPFSWGNVENDDGAREKYLQALRLADSGDYREILGLVREA